MVQKIDVTLLDDVDGSKAAETVTFGIDGRTYEIDLSNKNAAKLRKTMDEWVTHARSTSKRGKKRRPTAKVNGQSRRNGSTVHTASQSEIRQWAVAQGYEVSRRGSIARDIREAYYAAHN